MPFIGDGCMVDVRREDGTIERFALAAIDDELRDGFERLHQHPIDPAGEHPIARAMRSGEAQLPEQIEGEDRRRGRRSPEHLEDLRRFPGRLAMVAPIKAGDRLLGTLSIALSPQRTDFGPRDVALVKELARRASTAIENARLFSERTYIAETLQQSLLPASLPSVEGFDIAAIYRPALGGTEVGGDFYDVFETCGRRLGRRDRRRVRQGRGGRHGHRPGAPHPARRRPARCGTRGDARDGQRRAAQQLPGRPVLHARARAGARPTAGRTA